MDPNMPFMGFMPSKTTHQNIRGQMETGEQQQGIACLSSSEMQLFMEQFVQNLMMFQGIPGAQGMQHSGSQHLRQQAARDAVMQQLAFLQNVFKDNTRAIEQIRNMGPSSTLTSQEQIIRLQNLLQQQEMLQQQQDIITMQDQCPLLFEAQNEHFKSNKQKHSRTMFDDSNDSRIPMLVSSVHSINTPIAALKRKSEKHVDDIEWKRSKYQTEQDKSPSNDIGETPEHFESQVFIGNIPLGTLKREMIDLLKYYNVEVWIGKHRKQAEKCAFVTTSTMKESKRLISELDGCVYRGRPLDIRFTVAADFEDYIVNSDAAVNIDPGSERVYRQVSHDSHEMYSPDRQDPRYSYSSAKDKSSRKNSSPRRDSPVDYQRMPASQYISLSPVSGESSQERLDRSSSRSSHSRLHSYSTDYHNRDASKVRNASHSSIQYSSRERSPQLQNRASYSKQSSKDLPELSNGYMVIIENLPSDLLNHHVQHCIRRFHYKHLDLKLENGSMFAIVMFDSYVEAQNMIRDLDQSWFCGCKITVRFQEISAMSDERGILLENEGNNSVVENEEEFHDSSLFQSHIDASYADVPILGRKYIMEFRNEDGSSAYYVCVLCVTICSWRGIADHMVGYKHRMKCLKCSHPEVYEELCKINSKHEMLERCGKYAAEFVNPYESIISRIVKNPQQDASDHFTSIKDKNKSDNMDQGEEKKDSSMSDILKKIEAFKKKVNENKELLSRSPSNIRTIKLSSSNKETGTKSLAATVAAEIASFRVQFDKKRQQNEKIKRADNDVMKERYVVIKSQTSEEVKKEDNKVVKERYVVIKRKSNEAIKRRHDEETNRRIADNGRRKDETIKRKHGEETNRMADNGRREDNRIKRKHDEEINRMADKGRRNEDNRIKRKHDEEINRMADKGRRNEDNRIKRKHDAIVIKQYNKEACTRHYDEQEISQKHFSNAGMIGKNDASPYERQHEMEYRHKKLEVSKRRAYQLQKELDEERLMEGKGIRDSTVIETSGGNLIKETVTDKDVKTFKEIKSPNLEYNALETIEKSDIQRETKNKSIERTVEKVVGISKLDERKSISNDEALKITDLLDEGLTNMEEKDVGNSNMEKECDTAVSVTVKADNLNFSSNPDSKINQFFAAYLKKYPTNSAAIGLQYITEILPTNLSKCCTYLCALCDSECSGQSVAQHIVGYKHRMKYLYLHERRMYDTIMSEQKSRQALSYNCMKIVESVILKEGPQKIKSVTQLEYKQMKHVIVDILKVKIRSIPETMPQPDVVLIPPCKSGELEICPTPHKPVHVIAAETCGTNQLTVGINDMTGAWVSLSKGSTGVTETDSMTKVSRSSTVRRSTVELGPTEIDTIEMEDVECIARKISLNNDTQDVLTKTDGKHSGMAAKIRIARSLAKTVKPDHVNRCVWFYRYMQMKAEVPLLGLHYIVEIQGLYPMKPNTPTYCCELCYSHTKIEGSSAIYSHLLGAKHIEKYLKKHYPYKVAALQHIKMASDRSKYLQMQARLICESKGTEYIRLAVLDAYSSKNEAESFVPDTSVNTSTADASVSFITTVKKPSQEGSGTLKPSASGDDITAKLYDMITGLLKIPLVGLSYITETQGLYSKLPAKYDCALCNETINANFINAHLTGLDHRLKFLKENYPILHMKCENNWQMGEKFCREIEEQFGRESINVRKWIYTNPDGTAVYSKSQMIKDPYSCKVDATDKKRLETLEKFGVQINKIVDMPAVDLPHSEAVGDADLEFNKIIKGLDYSPMLGLQYINEVHHPTGAQSPKYECNVCNITGSKSTLKTKNILRHVCSRGHRVSFFKENHEHIYQELMAIKNLSAQNAALDRHTKEIESKVGRGQVQKVVAKVDTYWQSEDEHAHQEQTCIEDSPEIYQSQLESLQTFQASQEIPTGFGQAPTSTSTSQKLVSPESRLTCSTAETSDSNSFVHDQSEHDLCEVSSKVNEALAVKTKINSKEYPVLQKSINIDNGFIQNLFSEGTLAEKINEPVTECNSKDQFEIGGLMEETILQNTELENEESIIEVPDKELDINELRQFIASDSVASDSEVQKFESNKNPIIEKSFVDDDAEKKHTELKSESIMKTYVQITNVLRNVADSANHEVDNHVEENAEISETPDFESSLGAHISDDSVTVDVLIETENKQDNESIGIAVQNTAASLHQISDDKLTSSHKNCALDGKFQDKIEDEFFQIAMPNTPAPSDQVTDGKLTTTDLHNESIEIDIHNTPTVLDQLTGDTLTSNYNHDSKFHPIEEKNEITNYVTHVADDKVTVAITEPMEKAAGSTTDKTVDITITGMQYHNIIGAVEDAPNVNVHYVFRNREIAMETDLDCANQGIHLVDTQISVNEIDSHSGSTESKLCVGIEGKDICVKCLDFDEISNYANINNKIEIAKDDENVLEQEHAPFFASSQNSIQHFETHKNPVRLISADNTDSIPYDGNNYFMEEIQDNEKSSEEMKSVSLVKGNNGDMMKQSGCVNVKENTQLDVQSGNASEDNNDSCKESVAEDDFSQRNANDSLKVITESIGDSFKDINNTESEKFLHSSKGNAKVNGEKHKDAIETDLKQNDKINNTIVCDFTMYGSEEDEDDIEEIMLGEQFEEEEDDIEEIMLEGEFVTIDEDDGSVNLPSEDAEDMFLGEDFLTLDELEENSIDNTDNGKVGNKRELRSSKDIRKHHDVSSVHDQNHSRMNHKNGGSSDSATSSLKTDDAKAHKADRKVTDKKSQSAEAKCTQTQ